MDNSLKLIKCRLCKSGNLVKFLDLGKMPIPNGFLKKEDLKKKEPQYELACVFCRDCTLVQLTEVVNPDIMFTDYVYIPSVSRSMMNNLVNLAFYAHKELKIGPSSLVVDIGSNDGALLKFFKNYEARVLGADPARNLAQVAILNGIPTEVGMFNSAMARKIVKKYGQADLITATNVIAHIHDLDEVFKGLKILLKKDGVFITEFPYILDLIAKNQFDTIYHEHLSYFGLQSWDKFIRSQGFQIVDVTRRLIHGGSIRTVHKLNPAGSLKKSKAAEYLINLEKQSGFSEIEVYNEFAKRVLTMKTDLKTLLTELKKKGKRIIGMGAPAKGNVLTCFFEIGPDILDYIVDSTPYKQGLHTPLRHIPIYPETRLETDTPDYALILAWNFKDEIMRKNKLFKNRGGKFIIPVPEVKIV